MQTLLPIFVVIALGAALRHFSFPNPAFWSPAARITYYLFLPCLLINKVAATRFSGSETLFIAIVVITTSVMMTAMILSGNRWLGYSGPVITSVLQGGIRVNTYVGLATAAALLGSEGLAMAGVVHGIWILTVNVICVGALVVYCGEEGSLPSQQGSGVAKSIGSALKALAQNPMILACSVGLLLSLNGIALPKWLHDGLNILGQAALPVGLLLVGSGLQMDSLQRLGAPVLIACVAKLLAAPLLVLCFIFILPIGPLAGTVLVLVAALPSAASSYVLAQEMGGDAALMAEILTVETVLAAVTLPIVLTLVT